MIGGYTVKATDVVYSYALGSNSCHYQGHTAPIPAGVSATFSCDYLVTNATNYPVNSTLLVFENYGGGALGGSVSAPNSLQNVWQRVTFTSGPTSSAGTQAMFLYPGGCGTRLADSGTVYFRNPKVEWTNVDTGTENFSSMQNLTTWYDLNNRTNNGTLTNTPYFFISNTSTGSAGYLSFDGVDDYVSISDNSILDIVGDKTLSCWIYMGADSSGCGIAGKMSSASAGMALAYGWSGNGFQAIAWNSTNNPYLIKDATRDINKWVYLTSVQSDSTRWIYAWDSFGLRSSSYSGGTHSWNNNLDFYIGRSADASYVPTNTRISSVTVYNRALTAPEIQQNFQALRGRYGI